ncbi:MAG: OmpA family protein [Comamonadaceae bacterium]|nr:OmpA family protein [Comamonadaceae bacterium]
MKNKYLTPSCLAIAVLLAACGSAPKTTTLLNEIHSEYRVAQNNPNVATHAPLEMKQATDAMAQVDAMANDRGSDEAIDKLAYLARQKIALTQEVTKRKMAEADVANAGKVRNQMLIDQRTNEANAAKIKADQARQSALLAQNDAARAMQQTQVAQVDAANAQRTAQDAQARNALLEAQLADLAAKKTERGMVITLGDVLFGTDLSRLTSNGVATVQKLAKVLELNPQRKVLIEGFTDSTGTTAHNQDLSDRRAGAVQTALEEMGVGRNRVAVRGFGESYPVAANDTAENRQLNRRVEIVLSDDGGNLMAR